MSWATDQLKTAMQTVISEGESRQQQLESRIWVLEEFMRKAQPYIDTLALIDPPAKPE